MLYTAQLWLGLYRQPEEWPWLYVFLIFAQEFFVVTNAGRSLGLDAVSAQAVWPVRGRWPLRSCIPKGRLTPICGASQGSLGD
jgi:hypothetical protein